MPVAGVGAGRFAGLAPATGTAGTTETTGIVPGRCFALGIGSRASRGPMARCGSIASAQADGQERQHCFRTGQWLRAAALPSHGPMARCGSMACHFPAVSVVPVVPVRPLGNEIPRGRSSHWMVAFLAGGPANFQRQSHETFLRQF